MEKASLPSETAASFGGFVLAHAAMIASTLSDGELICPFAVVKKGDRRQVFDFEADTQAEAVERGKASLVHLKDQVEAWAFAREGLWSGPDLPSKIDVLVVSSWAPDMDEPLVLLQAFSPAQTGNFRLLGQLEITQDGQGVVSESMRCLISAAQAGIADSNVPWSSWLVHDA